MTSLVGTAMRRAGEGGLDRPVALLMGAAAAALILMMPIDVLQDVVLETGLPTIFAPADPPLGMKARLVLALVAGGLACALTYGLMRMLDGGSRPATPRPVKEIDDEVPAPRLRRRDRHPDAPPRAPLSAMRDLGTPFADEADADAEESPRRRAPLTMTMERLAQESAPPERPMPWQKPRSDEDVGEDRLQRIRMPREPEREPEPEPELAAAAPVEPAEEPFELVDQAEPDPVEAEALELVDEAEPEAEQEAAPDVAPDSAPVPPRVALAPQGTETVAELLARLERALDRRAPVRNVQEAAQAAPVPETADALDLRLRSALDNLKRFAPRHG